MIIAQQKRSENIAEYLIYMYQIEDMIRANKLDLDCPKLLRFNELSQDEFFCAESAAKDGVVFQKVMKDMTGGEIFVGGEVTTLGSDATLTDIDSAEIDEVMAFLDRYKIAFKGSFKNVINAGKKLPGFCPFRGCFAQVERTA